jgi:hypothetical protein
VLAIQSQVSRTVSAIPCIPTSWNRSAVSIDGDLVYSANRVLVRYCQYGTGIEIEIEIVKVARVYLTLHTTWVAFGVHV